MIIVDSFDGCAHQIIYLFAENDEVHDPVEVVVQQYKETMRGHQGQLLITYPDALDAAEVLETYQRDLYEIEDWDENAVFRSFSLSIEEGPRPNQIVVSYNAVWFS